MIRKDQAPVWFKDPDVAKQYIFDWATQYLASGVTISSATFTIPAGLTKDSQANTTGQSSVKISGGTHGTDYECKARIVCSDSTSEELTFWIKVRNQ